MEFEWDPDKGQENLKVHGVSFQEAMTVFDDPHQATVHDTLHSDDEDRWRTVGYSVKGRLIVVSHTDRGAKTRLISARTPTSVERETYERG